MALLALQKGRLVGWAKPNVPLVRWQKLLTSLLFSMVFVNAPHFNFFVRWGVLFFLGSACVSGKIKCAVLCRLKRGETALLILLSVGILSVVCLNVYCL